MTTGIKTAVLMAGLTVLLVMIGRAIGGFSGMIAFLMIGLVMNLVTYWFSDSIALRMSGEPLIGRLSGHT